MSGEDLATAFLGYEAIKCHFKNTKAAEQVSDITAIPIVVDPNVSTNRIWNVKFIPLNKCVLFYYGRVLYNPHINIKYGAD